MAPDPGIMQKIDTRKQIGGVHVFGVEPKKVNDVGLNTGPP
jgi:hypothetical protein